MIDPKTIVDVSTLATLFDLSAVRVQQLAADGVIVKAGRGRYELLPSIQGYIGYLQQRRSNQWDAPDLTSKRARLLDAQAEEAEMNNAVRRGSLASAGRWAAGRPAKALFPIAPQHDRSVPDAAKSSRAPAKDHTPGHSRWP